MRALVVGSLLLAGCAPDLPSGAPASIRARPNSEPWWGERHARLVGQAMRGHINLLFLGDSITQGWHGTGRDQYEGDGLAVWDDYYATRLAANFGMGSDRTENLLWRIRRGELAWIRPRVVVLLIGTNNLDEGAEATGVGVEAVLDEIHRRLPETRVLLLGLLPRGVRGATGDRAEPDPRIAEVNGLLLRLEVKPGVVYLDLGDRLMEADGMLAREVFPDFLHLSREGYRRIAEAIEPTLAVMLGERAGPLPRARGGGSTGRRPSRG
jgi:beta-glucosidase